MGIPDHISCLLKTFIQVKKQQLELYMEEQTGLKLGKGYIKAVCCHCLFNIYAENIMQNSGQYELQAGIKIARRNYQ